MSQIDKPEKKQHTRPRTRVSLTIPKNYQQSHFCLHCPKISETNIPDMDYNVNWMYRFIDWIFKNNDTNLYPGNWAYRTLRFEILCSACVNEICLVYWTKIAFFLELLKHTVKNCQESSCISGFFRETINLMSTYSQLVDCIFFAGSINLEGNLVDFFPKIVFMFRFMFWFVIAIVNQRFCSFDSIVHSKKSRRSKSFIQKITSERKTLKKQLIWILVAPV